MPNCHGFIAAGKNSQPISVPSTNQATTDAAPAFATGAAMVMISLFMAFLSVVSGDCAW